MRTIARSKFILIFACAVAASLTACSGSGANNGATNRNAANTNQKKTGIPPNAPAGAQPPQMAGSPTAAVTIEEFADFQCPQCAAKNSVFSEIRSIYGSRIKFIYRHFPLDIPAHDKSYDASVAAEAAGFQGKFWDMENLLFANQKTWSSDPNYKQVWKEYASRIGLDIAKWESDLIGLNAKERVDADKRRAQGAGVSSTPTVFVNGVEVPFASMTVDGLKALIDAELAKAAPAAPAGNPANSAPANK